MLQDMEMLLTCAYCYHMERTQAFVVMMAGPLSTIVDKTGPFQRKSSA